MNTTELNLIETAMRRIKSRQLYLRYHIIYLHLKGYKNVQIANIVPFTAQTIGTHIKTYEQFGLKGLTPKPRPGHPKKLSILQEGFLMYILINKTPSDLQFDPFMTGDCKLLCLWVKRQFNISYSKIGMRDLLKRLDFSFTRPTYTLARASQVKQTAFKQEFKCLKKGLLSDEFDHLLFQDECLIRDY